MQKDSQLTNEEQILYGRAHYQLGMLDMNNGDVKSAFNFLHTARELNPGLVIDSDAIIILGEHYAGDNNTTNTFDIYLRYITLKNASHPGAKKVYYLLEKLCAIDEGLSLSRVNDALSLNKKIVHVRPDIEWANYYLGLGYLIKKEYGNAIKYLESAIKLDSSRSISNYYLGKSLFANGSTEKALPYLRNVLSSQPANAEASFLVGKILVDRLERG
jgi:tetratricopeptide (TPR) repeat protein